MRFLASILFLLALLPVSAEARTLALLVGVADYAEGSGINDLLGPRNDVTMIWRALKARGVSAADIAVLADGIPAGAEFPPVKAAPLRATILAELDRLAAEAGRGDTVIFYYSGHGSEQPADPTRLAEEPEFDDMDQVLLPADAGSYDPITISIKNAIVDNLLGDKLSAIRAKGAFVWAVADSCHSGTVTRAVPGGGETTTRSVDPAVLNVPLRAKPSASRGGVRQAMLAAKPQAGEGGLVGFYAVDSSRLAIESPFPGYNEPMIGVDDKARMGIFTYHLHKALMAGRALTYRELAQEIVADMSREGTGEKAPQPVFDGDLEAMPPGADASRRSPGVTGLVASGTIRFPAGAMLGFDVGARLALYAPGEPDKVIGHARVTEATPVDSTASEIVWERSVTAIADGTIAATIAAPAITFRFVVAPPPAADLGDGAQEAAVAAAIATAFAKDAAALGLSIGAAGQPADLALRVKDGRLWIVRPDRAWVTTPGAYDQAPSLDLTLPADNLAAQLKNAVWSLARAAKLVRTISALGKGSGDGADLAITASLSRLPGQDPKGDCKGDKPPPGAVAAPLSPLLPAAAGNCDFIEVTVRNTSDRDYYVAGFYVDSLGGISAIPGRSKRQGCVRDLPPGEDKSLSFRIWVHAWDVKRNAPSSTGPENFVILGMPKGNANAAPQLCALTQPTLAQMQQERAVEIESTRNVSSRLASLIGAMAGGTRAGGDAEEESGQELTGALFVLDVVP